MSSSLSFNLWPLARPLLFSLEPELAHNLMIGLLKRWSAVISGQLSSKDPARNPRLAIERAGLRFPNPLGLSAGLDKDAQAIPVWQAMGFGFIEVGTVTALPQPGNPKPRLFRLPADRALINRMGFNNQGAEAMAARLQRLRDRNLDLVPLGVNIGKSKVTPPETAAADYARSTDLLADLADYLVVNVSSPNTPGLRDLQQADEVRRIVEAVQGPNQRLVHPRPVLLKLAPDLDDQAALDCARAALDSGCTGLILTNTSIDFSGLQTPTDGMSGGLSGAPIFPRSTALLRLVRQELGPDPLLIGVGGILSPEDAATKLAAGADLIQLYTGLIYQGPKLVRHILRTLATPSSH